MYLMGSKCTDMVRKGVLDRFVTFGGYDCITKKRTSGKWCGISAAARKTGLSRPTIYEILKESPEKPHKTCPKYVETFTESEGYKRLQRIYQKKLARSSWRATVKDVRDAWKVLGGSSKPKKDPISWTEDDFRKIWSYDLFIDPLAGGLEEHHGTSFRRLMRAINRHDLLAKFESKTRPAGLKRYWFLRDEEIVQLIAHVDRPDVLLFIFRGICEGARASALLQTKVHNIAFYDHSIQVFEPKTKQLVVKYPPTGLFTLIERYVHDQQLNYDDRLFPRSYPYYNEALKTTGKKAGLRKTVTTQILKHTFVTQAHRHNVSAETITDQTGTQFRTLVKYYQAKDEKKIRHEMQGTAYGHVPFYEWVERLTPYFEERYNEIRN